MGSTALPLSVFRGLHLGPRTKVLTHGSLA